MPRYTIYFDDKHQYRVLRHGELSSGMMLVDENLPAHGLDGHTRQIKEIEAPDDIKATMFAKAFSLFYSIRSMDKIHIKGLSPKSPLFGTAIRNALNIMTSTSFKMIWQDEKTKFEITPTLFDAKGKPVLDEKEEPSKPVIEIIKFVSTELLERLSRDPDYFHKLTPRQFEEVMAETVFHLGWEVELTAPSNDGGFDIFAFKKEDYLPPIFWLLECKKWGKKNPVGVEIVRGLYGVVNEEEGRVGTVLTTSRFTRGAKAFADKHFAVISLQDYLGIQQMLIDALEKMKGE